MFAFDITTECLHLICEQRMYSSPKPDISKVGPVSISAQNSKNPNLAHAQKYLLPKFGNSLVLVIKTNNK